MSHRLTPLLAPRSIAFVGATPRRDTPGNDMLRMIDRAGYAGAVFAVNPNYKEVEGRRCWPSIGALPQPVDLAVLAVANARIEAALDDAIAAGAKAAVIFGSLYLENDADPPLTRRIAALARRAGMPVCGGNGMGFYNDVARVWACGFPAARAGTPGGITFISHAGSVFGAFAHNDPRYRFNLVISAGQELVTTAADYLDYALDQPETRVVGLFLETVRDPPGFVRALDKATARGIPVVALKVGRTAASAALALSHSGAVAGNVAAYAALFDRYGVHRVDTLDELGSSLLLFAQGRTAAAGCLAAIHDSGGEREMLIDLAEAQRVPFARLAPRTVARLRERLDYGLEPVNPLDAWGTGRDFVDVFSECFAALVADPDVALGLFFNDIRNGFYVSEGIAEACRRVLAGTAKPVALATNYTQLRHDALALALSEAGVPVLDGTVPALLAASHLMAQRDFRRRAADPAPAAAPSRDWRLRLRAGAPLDEQEGLALLADYGIPVLPSSVVEGVEAAAEEVRRIGFPAVCKTAMPEIRHKSDVAGVKLALADEAALRRAAEDLASRLGPRLLVTRMAPPGTELALGMIADAQFGPVVMVAAGGTLIEVLRDARYGLAPFGPATARRLVDGLAVRPVLDGVRGAPPADLAALAETIARFSVLVADLGEFLGEVDVNPLIVGPGGAVAVDALVVAKKEA
jgi:acyl-CoA synthetase (NDP forming)